MCNERLYEEINSDMASIFREVYRANSSEFGYSKEEQIEAIKVLISEKDKLDCLLKKILHFLGKKKIKNININEPNRTSFFHLKKHELISVLCGEDDANPNYFAYQVIAFYIVTVGLVENLKISEKRKGSGVDFPAASTIQIGQETQSSEAFHALPMLSVLTDIYFSLSALLTKSMKVERCIEEKRPTTILSETRSEIDVILGIRKLLYNGTRIGLSTNDLVNVAVLDIRNYLENWIRRSLDAFYDENNQPLKMSFVLNCLVKGVDKNINSLPLKDYKKYVDNLIRINKWSNKFVHSQNREIVWVPHIVFMYICQLHSDLNANQMQPLRDISHDGYVRNISSKRLGHPTGVSLDIIQPIVEKNSTLYNSVQEELFSC